MPSKKHDHSASHKPYAGPWPEQHPSIPGRVSKVGPVKEKNPLPGHPNATQLNKIPPQTPK